MATTKAISGNVVHNNGGVALGAGAVPSTDRRITYNLTLAKDNAADPTLYGSRVFQAVSPTSSGNIGTFKPVTGNFGKMVKGEYVGKIIGTKIAGQANTVLRSGASDYNRKGTAKARPYRRYDNTSWNYVTGALTKGASAGAAVQFVNPVGGGAIDEEALPTRAIPGELVYLVTGLLPTQVDYSARNLW